ncbi:MAG: MerC domain-containing protein [Myxococcota bacterium]
MTNRSILQKSFDLTAVALSVTCGIHCAIVPIAMVFFPILGSHVLTDEAFHTWMLVGILPTSFVALFLGCRKHKDGPVICLCLAGITTLVLTALFGHDLFGETGEGLVTTLGGIILIAGHGRNFILCRKAGCEK